MSALEAGKVELEKAGAAIYGINPGTITEHRAYCEEKGFSIDLLADTKKTVTRYYEALGFAGLYVRRTVYIVGPKQRLVFGQRGMPSNEILLSVIEKHQRTDRES